MNDYITPEKIRSCFEEYNNDIPLHNDEEKCNLIKTALKILIFYETHRKDCDIILFLIDKSKGKSMFSKNEYENSLLDEKDCIEFCKMLIDDNNLDMGWYWHLGRSIILINQTNNTWEMQNIILIIRLLNYEPTTDHLKLVSNLLLKVEPDILQLAPFCMKNINFDKNNSISSEIYKHLDRYRNDPDAKKTIFLLLNEILDYEKNPEKKDSWLKLFMPQAINAYMNRNYSFFNKVSKWMDNSLWATPSNAFDMLLDIEHEINKDHILYTNSSGFQRYSQPSYLLTYIKAFFEQDTFDPEPIHKVIEKHPEIKQLILNELSFDQIFEHFDGLTSAYPELFLKIIADDSSESIQEILDKNAKLKKHLKNKKSFIPKIKELYDESKNNLLSIKLTLLYMIGPGNSLKDALEVIQMNFEKHFEKQNECFRLVFFHENYNTRMLIEFIKKWDGITSKDIYLLFKKYPWTMVILRKHENIEKIQNILENPEPIREILLQYPALLQHIGNAKKVIEGRNEFIPKVMEEGLFNPLYQIYLLQEINTTEADRQSQNSIKNLSDEDFSKYMMNYISKSSSKNDGKDDNFIELLKDRKNEIVYPIWVEIIKKIGFQISGSLSFYILTDLDLKAIEEKLDPYEVSLLIPRAYKYRPDSLNKILISVKNTFTNGFYFFNEELINNNQYLKEILGLFFRGKKHKGNLIIDFNDAVKALHYLCIDNQTDDSTKHSELDVYTIRIPKIKYKTDCTEYNKYADQFWKLYNKNPFDIKSIKFLFHIPDYCTKNADKIWQIYKSKPFKIDYMGSLFYHVIKNENSAEKKELWLNRMLNLIINKVEGWETFLFCLLRLRKQKKFVFNPLYFMRMDTMISVLKEEFLKIIENPDIAQKARRDDSSNIIVKILIYYSGLKIWKKTQKQLQDAGVSNENIINLFTLPDTFYPHRLNLDKIFIKAEIKDEEQRNKMLDRCDDDILPGLLRLVLNTLIESKVNLVDPVGRYEQSDISNILFLKSVYIDYPKAWARTIVNIFKKYNHLNLHWYRGFAFALGKLREPMGGNVPKLLAKAATDKSHPKNEIDARKKVAEIQRSLFNRENYHIGAKQSPKRKVFGALNSILDAHKKFVTSLNEQ